MRDLLAQGNEGLDQPTALVIEFDALGQCTTCRMLDTSIARVQRLIEAREARALTFYPGCNHVLVYRSIGAWTEKLK